jgi:hypothetical protein
MPLPTSQPVPTPIPDDPPEPRWMYAELTADGTTTITIGASVVTLPPAADLDSGRRQMIVELRKAAAQLNERRVWVEITDPDGVWPTEVPADGPLLALDKGPAGRGLTPVPDLPAPPRSPGPVPRTMAAPAPTPPAPARREATPPPRQRDARGAAAGTRPHHRPRLPTGHRGLHPPTALLR